MSKENGIFDRNYKKNFLTNVIARVDIASPQDTLKNKLPKELNNIAVMHFPISEPKSAFSQEFKITQSEFSTQKQDFIEWNFFGGKRDKRLTINQQYYFVEYKKYNNFETVKKEFVEFSEEFFNHFSEAQPSRIGLRYINEIDNHAENPLLWDKEINKKLLCLFKLNYSGSSPIRIFHNFEIKYSNFNLRFQFGIYNPDYPAIIHRRHFILDYDAYYQGMFDPSEISEFLVDFHSKIQDLFEDSITDKLREVMNETR